jgi:hypothetical protein
MENKYGTEYIEPQSRRSGRAGAGATHRARGRGGALRKKVQGWLAALDWKIQKMRNVRLTNILLRHAAS